MWVVVGASSGLGRALAEELARRGQDLLLAASDARDLEALAPDLRLRFGVSVEWVAHDGMDHAGLADSLFAQAEAAPAIEGIMLPIGSVDDEDDGLLSPDRAERLVHVNLLAVSTVVSRFLPRLERERGGRLIGFGSIAASRGRSRNPLYAAAKGGLATYFEGLRHRCEPRGVGVTFYVLGYLDTAMAYGKPLLLRPADPARVARRICDRLGRDTGRHYLPRFWGPLCWGIRSLPWFLFKRLQV